LISKQDEVDLQGIFGKEVSDIALYNPSGLADAKFNSTRHNIIETVLSKVSSELPELASITAFSDGNAKLHVIFDDNITFSLQKSTECYIGDEVSFDPKADLANVRQAYTVYLGGMAELMFIDITTESINGKGVPGELTYHIAFTEPKNDKDKESKLPNSLLIVLEHRDCGLKFLQGWYDLRQKILDYFSKLVKEGAKISSASGRVTIGYWTMQGLRKTSLLKFEWRNGQLFFSNLDVLK